MSFSNRVVRKWDHSYDTDEKLGQSCTFSSKKGLILYLTALKRGAIPKGWGYSHFFLHT